MLLATCQLLTSYLFYSSYFPTSNRNPSFYDCKKQRYVFRGLDAGLHGTLAKRTRKEPSRGGLSDLLFASKDTWILTASRRQATLKNSHCKERFLDVSRLEGTFDVMLLASYTLRHL